MSWESHPDYNPYTLDYDYAIVTLRHPLSWRDKVKPICLPTPTEVVLIRNTIILTQDFTATQLIALIKIFAFIFI